MQLLKVPKENSCVCLYSKWFRDQSPTLVIRRHAWMRKIHDDLFPGDFGVVDVEVCTLVHQVFANVDTGGLSAGETNQYCFK